MILTRRFAMILIIRTLGKGGGPVRLDCRDCKRENYVSLRAGVCVYMDIYTRDV